MEIKKAGTLDQLKMLAEAKKNEGDSKSAGSLYVVGFVFDERCKFDNIDNDKFPEVKGTTLEEYLKENPNVKI